MKTFTITPCPRGGSAYPLRVVDISRGDPLFQVVPAYAYGKDGRRWYQDRTGEFTSRELADFVCASLNQAAAQVELVRAALEVVESWESGDLAASVRRLSAAVEGVK